MLWLKTKEIMVVYGKIYGVVLLIPNLLTIIYRLITGKNPKWKKAGEENEDYGLK